MIPGIGVFLIGSGEFSKLGALAWSKLTGHPFSGWSALCGAAQSMTWLIGARAMQGFGGGAIISLTQIIIGDIIPLHKRGVSLPSLSSTVIFVVCAYMAARSQSANSWVGSIWGM
jgi:MFS family permease